jgi:hypothetical protein
MSEFGKITIWKSKNKITNNHPDYSGKIVVTKDMPAGEYQVGLYLKKPKKGTDKYQLGTIWEAWKKPPVPHFQDK